MKYDKPPLLYTEQIALLKSRGLIIDDEVKAADKLANVSYFRLSAYMFPFKKKVDGKIIDEFRYGTTWNDVYHMYVFDRKLRLLVFDAIEKIEVAVRSQMVYHLSHKYGSHWQDNAEIFATKMVTLKDGSQKEVRVFDEIQKHIKEQLSSSQTELFIEHYRDTYHEPVNPPSWMCVEVMYFNQLSKICSYLKERSDVTGIASHFGLPPKVFTSWLHSINYVRNICAHHARLWNRDLKIVPANLEFSKSGKWLVSPKQVQRGKMYYFLCMLNYILQSVNPKSSFTKRLKELIIEYKPRISAMGFPENWENEEIWK
jgi:abortive infection bacteriophage resistance protein